MNGYEKKMILEMRLDVGWIIWGKDMGFKVFRYMLGRLEKWENMIKVLEVWSMVFIGVEVFWELSGGFKVCD